MDPGQAGVRLEYLLQVVDSHVMSPPLLMDGMTHSNFGVCCFKAMTQGMTFQLPAGPLSRLL